MPQMSYPMQMKPAEGTNTNG